jgi:hypothetical protein
MISTHLKDALFAVGFCVLALVLRAVDPAPSTDPERWYHYAVSRAWMEGMPHALPAAEGVGWDAAFPEREVLFHAATAAGYWLAA